MVRHARVYAVVAALLAACATAVPEARAQAADPASELLGLWKAKRRFGPDARGPLMVERTGAGYTADMMGFVVPVKVDDGERSFELPNREGAFRGRPQAGGTIRGFWFPAASGSATPVTLSPHGPNRWSGQVAPVDEEQTFYLLVSRRPDGSLAALLRNLERDYGSILGVRGLVRTGDRVTLTGGRVPTRDTVVATGSYDPAGLVITLTFPTRGGS